VLATGEASLDALNVPEVILLALVVSVVADAAKPVTFADGILPETLTACPSVERFLDNVI
jgi:hypothetical protein